MKFNVSDVILQKKQQKKVFSILLWSLHELQKTEKGLPVNSIL